MGSAHLILRKEVAGNLSLYFCDPVSNVTWQMATTATFDTLPIFTWIRISAVMTSSSVGAVYISYIDSTGTLQQSTYTVTFGNIGAYIAGPQTFTIGTSVGFPEYPPEVIDDVRIWNIARTQQQCYDNWNKELRVPTTGLAAYYKLNEGYVHNNPSPTVVDSVTSTNILNVFGAVPYPHSLVQG